MKMTPLREENMEMCVVRIRAIKMSRLEGARPEIKCSTKETYFRRKKASQINILYFEERCLEYLSRNYWTESSAFQRCFRVICNG